MNRETYVILHNIRSLHNVGSVFRTGDAVGISKIYLTGYTPLPVDEMQRFRSEIVKTALGAEKTIAWEYVASPSKLITRLKKEGVEIIALENTGAAVDYRRARVKERFALLVGNEVRGLSPKLLEKCDQVIQIPMVGKKESLNVSVAFGVGIYRLRFP